MNRRKATRCGVDACTNPAPCTLLLIAACPTDPGAGHAFHVPMCHEHASHFSLVVPIETTTDADADADADTGTRGQSS